MEREEILVYKKTIELARNRRKEYEKKHPNGEECNLNIDLDEILNMDPKEKILNEYLNAQEYETVKSLILIMYLGIGGFGNEFNSPEEILNEQRKYFDNCGWEEKEVIINQMMEKMPLDIYLKKGLEKLKI